MFQVLTSPAGMLALVGCAAGLIWVALAFLVLSRQQSVAESTLGARSLIWVIGLAPAVAQLVAPRAVYSGNTLIDAPPLAGLALRVSQGLTLTGLSVSLLIIASQHWTATTGPHRPGRRLVAALLAIYASVTVSALFGGHGGFDRQLIVLPIVIIALHVAPRMSATDLVQQLRLIFRVYIYGSLLALTVAPTWAFFVVNSVGRDYFHLGGQLSGLTPHPNALGAIAATALMLELASVERKRTWPIHVTATVLVLLLAESRTAWIAALLGVMFLRSSHRSLRPARWIGVCALTTATVAFVLFPRIASLTVNALSGGDLQTLNGRTGVWKYAYDQFLANPLIGFGPNLFDAKGPEAAVGAFPVWAGQAHNQLFQTLGETGIIGTVAVVVFILTLLATSAKRSRALAGLSSAMMVIMFTRSFSEAPLASVGGYDSSFALLFFLIAVMIAPLDPTSHDPLVFAQICVQDAISGEILRQPKTSRSNVPPRQSWVSNDGEDAARDRFW